MASVALSACEPTRYAYAPVTTTSADLAGASAAAYGIPPDAPRGDVRLAMMGISSLAATEGAPGSRDRGDTMRTDAIHIGLAVSNRSDQAWTVDPSEQHLTLTVKQHRNDIWATNREMALSGPVVVPPRSTRMIDLYFPLPIDFKKEDAPPPFDVVWTVHAGAQPVSRRTTFQRFIVSPAPEPGRDVRTPDDVGNPSDQLLPGTNIPDRRPVLPPIPSDPLDPIEE
jgi:hypothetical protein